MGNIFLLISGMIKMIKNATITTPTIEQTTINMIKVDSDAVGDSQLDGTITIIREKEFISLFKLVHVG